MSEADALFKEAFNVMGQVFGWEVISTGAGVSLVAKNCILNNVVLTREQRDAGMRLDYDSVAEITREDAAALGLYPLEEDGKRPSCMVAGRSYKRMGLEDDRHDPMVRLHLKAQAR